MSDPDHPQSEPAPAWLKTVSARTPEHYGAVGDGRTDDTAAFNRALALGIPLLLAPTTYHFKGTLNGAVTGSALIGFDRNATILSFENGADDCIVVDGTPKLVGGFELRNLWIQCSGKTGGRTVYMTHVGGSTIDNVYVSTLWTGFEFYIANNVLVSNTVIDKDETILGGNSAYGIWWHGPTDGSTRSNKFVTNNTIVNAGFGGADGYLWSGMAQTWNGYLTVALNCRYGMRIFNPVESSTHYPQDAVFTNFVTDGMILCGLRIEALAAGKWSNSFIENTSGDGPAQGGADTNALTILADTGGSHTSNLSFDNCDIGLSHQSAVWCAAQNVRFIGCNFMTGITTPPNTYPAVYLAAPATSVQIIGCCSSNFGNPALIWSYGVVVEANTFNIQIDSSSNWGVVERDVQWMNTDSVSRNQGNQTTGTFTINDISGNTTPQAVIAVAGATLTPANLLGYVLWLTDTLGDFTNSTTAAAEIVAALVSGCFGKTVPVSVINATDGAMTLTPGTGITMAGNTTDGAFVVAAGTTRVLNLYFVNLAPGQETMTVFG